MAISKQELTGKLSDKQLAMIVEYEGAIDHYLEEKYNGESFQHPLFLDIYHKDRKVYKELVRRYEVVGWVIKHEDDQRDGDCVIMS